MQTVDQIISRAQRRELDLWAPFEYAVVLTADHDTVVGLYTYTGENALVFLKELGTEELAGMVDGFTLRLLALTNDEACLALKIATQKYNAGVKAVALAAKRATKRDKIAADVAYVNAQIDALAADEAALATRKFEAETKHQAALIEVEDLKARVAAEGYEKDRAELAVSEKALDLAKAKLARLLLALEVIEVQQKINQAALEDARIDNEVAEWQNRIAAVAVEILELANRSTEVTQEVTRIAIEAAEARLDVSETLLRVQQVLTDRAGVAVNIAEVSNRVAELSKQLLGITLRGKELDRATLEAIYAGLKVDLGVLEAERRITLAKIDVAGANIDMTEADQRRTAAFLDRRQADTEALEIARKYVLAAIEGMDIETQTAKLAGGSARADTDALRIDVDSKELEARRSKLRMLVGMDAVDAVELAAKSKELQYTLSSIANDTSEAARRTVDAQGDIEGVTAERIRLETDVLQRQTALALLGVENVEYDTNIVQLQADLLRNSNEADRDLGLYTRAINEMEDQIAWQAERTTLADTLRAWRKKLIWQGLYSGLLNTAGRIIERQKDKELAAEFGKSDFDFAKYQRQMWQDEIRPLDANDVAKKIRRVIQEANGAAQAAANICDAKIDGFLAIDNEPVT